MESNYSKLFAGSFIVAQRIVQNLKEQGISPIVKDETESARLAGFGTSTYGFQELYVHASEIVKAETIVAKTLAEF
tara:strand:+ start:599 stop:826 length:228 start_codon:yes stop_codon:yes gene_type:complete